MFGRNKKHYKELCAQLSKTEKHYRTQIVINKEQVEEMNKLIDENFKLKQELDKSLKLNQTILDIIEKLKK